MTKRIVCLTIVSFFLGSCFGTTGEKEGMDIVVERKPAQEKSATKQSNSTSIDKTTNESGTQTTAVFDDQSVVDWRAIFKAPPTNSERQVMAERLSKWKDDGTAESAIKAGRNAGALGQYGKAEAFLRRSLRLSPKSVISLLELCKLSLRHGDSKKCVDFLSRAKKILADQVNPTGELVFRHRYLTALTYITNGERELGHKALTELIALDRTFAPGYTALATSYMQADKIEAAEFVARQGIDSVGEDAAIYNVLGTLAYKQGKEESARDYFQKALKIKGDYAPALINLANVSIRSFEYDVAEANLQKAIAVAPDNSTAFVALGILHKKRGRIEAAKNALKKAIDIDAENSAARFNLAVLNLDHLNEPTIALRLFYEVVHTPDASSKVKELAQLYIQDIREQRAH